LFKPAEDEWGALSFSNVNKTPFKVFVNLQWNGSDSEIL